VPKPSTTIELGPYRLDERIGEGGVGQVYRADGPTGPVAVKILGPASDLDDAARARFHREIAALGQITHPHLVPLLDHGLDAELGPYLVLPLLPGATLRTLIAGRALGPDAALLLAEPIAQATAALHAAGYVHRDLKPENVIAGPDGSITVIDLGLAWREGMTRHTDTGAAVGSVGYMSPEQLEGRPVDDRTDVWALGVMLHEWTTGTRPFARDRAAEEAAAVLLGTCRRLTTIDQRCSEQLGDLVARCLAIDPARRPRADELARAITAQIDAPADHAAERAAAIADPTGYAAHIAPQRARDLARRARESLATGAPFVALAHCDRGLAYVPDDTELLALVSAAEPSPVSSEQRTSPPAPTTTRSPRRRWWLVLAALPVIVIVAALALPSSPPPPPSDPWATSSSSDQPPPASAMAPSDRALLGSFITLFGKALDARDANPRPARTGLAPTTATGWLELAADQSPPDAVASIRHALTLQPGWPKAQSALCVALAAAHDPGAVPACDTALRSRPDEIPVLGARAAARLDTGDPADAAAALADLDRVVAADPDPLWRRLRARARELTGDHAGAQRDLTNACELGDAAACKARATK
jgi:protein kinase-like protein